MTSPSIAFRGPRGDRGDVRQFMAFTGLPAGHYEQPFCKPLNQVTTWRGALTQAGLADLTVTRKGTTLRSLITSLTNCGVKGANPAHPREGKAVGLGARDCLKLLDAPPADTPVGLRDRALLAVLAFSDCRVDEITKIKVGHRKNDGGRCNVEIQGKTQRNGALPSEAFERLAAWIVEAVCVCSLMVSATTLDCQQGVDILELPDWLGHEDPRTTRDSVRGGEKLHRSPAYVLRY